MVGISGLGRCPRFQSWWMAGSCHCLLIQGIAPVPSFFGLFVWFSCPKVKNVSFKVIALALEVNIGFGLRSWFISRFLASVPLGIGVFPLLTVSWDLQFIALGWAGWFWFDNSRTFPWYELIMTEICIISLISNILDR